MVGDCSSSWLTERQGLMATSWGTSFYINPPYPEKNLGHLEAPQETADMICLQTYFAKREMRNRKLVNWLRKQQTKDPLPREKMLNDTESGDNQS